MQETFAYYRQLRQELSRWLEQSVRMDGPGPNHGGEDEANYSLTWFPHYLVTGDEKIPARFRALLNDLETWVDMECLHGYEPEAEAHHGTEPFLLFLPRYLGLFPKDEVARALLEDVAHHIGNWVDEIPPWYDFNRDLFHSYQIGTKIVSDEPRFAYELAEHFRFIHIALAAYRTLGEERYLEWSLRYGRKRAERILKIGDGPLPVLWDLEGNGLLAAQLVTREQRSMAGSNHHLPGDPLAGIENLLASGAIYALGDLFQISGDSVFQEAARRIAAPLVRELLDPFADPAAAAVSYYRWTFDDTSLDAEIVDLLEQLPPPSETKWAMVFPEERTRREPGVGKRSDMIYWGEWSEDGSVEPLREPCTATLTLAYQLTGEEEHVRRAFATAATKLTMARRVLRGGREHTDMGGAICSVTAGHGRNWGQGAVTGCYGPLLLGTRDLLGAITPLIEMKDGHIPQDLLPLVQPPVGGDGAVMFYNGGEDEVRFAWRPAGDSEWMTATLSAKESRLFHIGSEG